MKQILVVDDNLSILKQIATHLSGEYDVSLAKSGVSALQICIKEKPDLILLDIEMPDFNGFDVMERIKQNPYLNRIPVIFLTANHDAETEIKALELGARDFLTKPVRKSVLLHRIALHLHMASYQAQTEKAVMTLSDSIAISFAELIEYRDENTGGHVIRTSKLVDRIGRELITRGFFTNELNESELEMMVRAAPLHDMGKIAISDRILLKAGRLDDEEFSIMKRHTLIGGDIIGRMYHRIPTQHYLHYASVIASFHHERYDGKGYPHGLKGDNIPLCARIMAVADVYDALMASRVYRTRMSHSNAMDIVKSSRYTQFDPRIVDVFTDISEELSQDYLSQAN
jgi:putative two-component system response regulator